MDNSLEFTYDELAKATSDFRLVNKIGQCGFGVVYYQELKGAGKTLRLCFEGTDFSLNICSLLFLFRYVDFNQLVVGI